MRKCPYCDVDLDMLAISGMLGHICTSDEVWDPKKFVKLTDEIALSCSDAKLSVDVQRKVDFALVTLDEAYKRCYKAYEQGMPADGIYDRRIAELEKLVTDMQDQCSERVRLATLDSQHYQQEVDVLLARVEALEEQLRIAGVEQAGGMGTVH